MFAIFDIVQPGERQKEILLWLVLRLKKTDVKFSFSVKQFCNCLLVFLNDDNNKITGYFVVVCNIVIN